MTQGQKIDEVLESVNLWMSDYISAPHPEIGRQGPICPFVAPSRKNRTMELRIRFVGNSPTIELIEEIGRSSLKEFDLISWQGRNPMLRAMVIAMPDLAPEDTPLLDEAQVRIKSEFVENGLMVGQFHQNCTVPAARNEGFAVSKAPVPVLAIRKIALHDIFFLSERKEWFEKYREEFGHFYNPEQAEFDDRVRVKKYEETAAYYGAC